MYATEETTKTIKETTKLAKKLGFKVISDGFIEVAGIEVDLTDIGSDVESIARKIAIKTRLLGKG